jgi:hypothetical protein
MRMPDEAIKQTVKQMRWRGAAILFDWLVEGGERTQYVYEFFCNPVSHYRGLDETNIMQPGMLSPPQGFATHSLHCYYGTTKESEREAFRESYTLEFQILHKIYYRSPLAAIPYQGIAFPWVDDIPKDWPNQPGDLATAPHYIGPLMLFQVRLVGKPVKLTRPLKFLPVLNGMLDMAVQ